jgi:hypothetical protein
VCRVAHRTLAVGGIRRPPLGAAFALVVATDLVGGALDVTAGRSTWASAWGSRATLCAPAPMMAGQAIAVLITTRATGPVRRTAAGLLAGACFVSILSGFFDGQLARSDLDRGEVGFQAWLLTVTAILGTLAGLTAAERDQAATLGQQS